MGVKVGSFTKSTSTSTPVVQDVTLPFDPKSLILECVAETADNAYTGSHANYSIGFSDGVNERCMNFIAEDVVTKSDSSRYMSPTKGIVIRNAVDGSILAEGNITFGTGKFTITWTTNNAVAYLIKYHAYTVQSEVGTITTTTSTGIIHYSTTNLPKFVMIIAQSMSSENTDVQHNLASIGFSDGTNEGVVSLMNKNGQNTSNTRERASSSNVLMSENPNVPTTNWKGSMDAFVTSPDNGFNINWSQALARKFYYISFYEGDWEVGTGDTKTSTIGTKSYITTIQPDYLMTMSAVSGTLDTASDSMTFGLGASDGTNNIASGVTDEDNAANMNTQRAQYSTDCLIQGDPLSVTPKIRARQSAFAATSFTLDYQNVLGTANKFHWAVLKDAAGGLTAVNRVFNVRHDISEQVNRTFNVRHDVLILVNRIFNLRHDISEFINRTFNIRHDIFEIVSRVFNIRHDIFNLIGRTFNVRHDIAEFVSRTFNVRHDLAGVVNRVFNIRHDILSSLSAVNRVFNIRHDILNIVGRTFNLRHDVLIFVNRVFSARHDILNIAENTFSIRHDISNIVNRIFNVRHDLAGTVNRIFNLRHDVNGVVLPVPKRIAIDSIIHSRNVSSEILSRVVDSVMRR